MAFLFTSIGQIDDIYTRYFDSNQYFCYERPVTVDKLAEYKRNFPSEQLCYDKTSPNFAIEKKNYRPGDKVVLQTRRVSLIDIPAKINNELVLIRKSGGEKLEVDAFNIDATIQKGEERLAFDFKLPIDLESGDYFYRGSIHYRIKNQSKVYTWESETFLVTTTEK
jgi:hypothetical protein